MSQILIVTISLVSLILLNIVLIILLLKPMSKKIESSKYILNRFESDNTAPKLTKIIEFHKNNKDLNKYNINWKKKDRKTK